MTRVDFYELADIGKEARDRFACRLALRARDAGVDAVVLAEDQTAAKDLDDLMWQYPRERFLPHGVSSEASPNSRVHIAASKLSDVGGDGQLLINLKDKCADGWQSFARVAEIIVGDTREASREKYRYYRTQVTELHHHRLDDWET